MAELSPIEQQSEVKRLQRSLELFSACNREIIRAETETNLLHNICQLMVDLGGYRFAWVGDVRHDPAQTVELVVYAGEGSAYLESIQVTWADTDLGKGPTGRAIRSGQPCLVQDINTEADYAPWQQSAQQQGYRASIALPLIDRDGVFGTLNLYATIAKSFHPEEVQLLTQLAADLSYGVATLRANQLRQATEQALQESYAQYDHLVNQIPVGVYKFRMSADGDMQFLYASPRWGEMNQLDPAAVIADPALAFAVMHPDEIDAFVQLNEQARNTLNQFVWEGRMVINGAVRWRHIESAPTPQANGDIIWDGIQYDITEVVQAKQAQAHLLTEATNARDVLSSVFARMHDGIVALDTNWHYTYVNDRAATLLGRPAAELIGKHIWTEFPDGVGKPFYHAYYQAAKQQTVVDLEEYYEPWNRWFENRIYPDAHGLTIYFTETTDRKIAELAIAASEQRYASLATAAPVGIFRTDAEGNCLYVNDRWMQIAGLSIDEALGTGWLSGLHPDDRQMIQAEWYRAAQEHRLFCLEYRFQRADGGISWVYGQAAAELDGNGAVAGYVGTITDITDRKAAEAERLQAEQIHRELKLLEDVLDIVLAGYWEWRIPEHRHYMSFGWKRMLGYEHDELPTRPETWQELIFPEDLPLVMGHFDQHVQSHGQVPYYNEVRYRHKDGSTVWLICSGRVIEWDAAGNPLRMIGCHIDITDRKQSEAQLQQLNQELQRSNQDLEQFAYITSHDLQEPLRAIIGYTQLLDKNYREALSDPAAQESLGFIIEGGQRMRQLIQDLLTYARTGSQPLKLVSTDCNLVLAVVLQNLQASIDETQTVITSDNLPTLHIDQTQLMQLLQNLIGNAIKFRGEAPPQIHISAMPQFDPNATHTQIDRATYYQFSITDNGIGVKLQYLTQIFEIFRRLHPRSRFPGTGIGLAVSRKIVERHGGTIWATSELGQGTTFIFTLSANLNKNNE
jgi:PAS domain S-box-containing protein